MPKSKVGWKFFNFISMKIFPTNVIRQWDQHTIENEPISSIDLMERASISFVDFFTEKFPETSISLKIFCGTGNNGGDGLAIARLLYRRFYDVEVFIVRFSKKHSEDFEKNLKRLPKEIPIKNWTPKKSEQINNNKIIIDAILGSGLTREIKGELKDAVDFLNLQQCIKISVDIPSGLFADKKTNGISFIPDYTFSFQTPKLAFLISENEKRVGEFHFGSIGLDSNFHQNTNCNNLYLTKKTIKKILRSRNRFSHKGNYGHALLIAGSKGKTGAAVLSAKACLRSGVGLLSIQIPASSNMVLQTSVPEAMTIIDKEENFISSLSVSELENYNAIGIGPGLGKKKKTRSVIRELLNQKKIPLVLDADALNIIAENNNWEKRIPENSILTPHPKEFERLFGACSDAWDRLEKCREKSIEHQIIIILKGANTCIALPSGKCYFNSTGNPGMATAGSGDVLTGIITGLLAAGYSSGNAAVLGVYLHGLAGDIALDNASQESLIASDIIDHLGRAFNSIKK